jgi:hypothetical protein
MNLIRSLYNKVQYLVSKNVSDPKADAYARQQELQNKHDEAVREREEEIAKEKEELAKDEEERLAKQATEEKKASDLSVRSRFDTKQLVHDSAIGILKALGSLIYTILCLYGGYISANNAIGYNNPFRILSFIYGSIFAFYVIPMAIYRVYGKGETMHHYSFLPLSTYVPKGNFEYVLIGPYCYQEDESSVAARRAVEILYSDAYNKSAGK